MLFKIALNVRVVVDENPYAAGIQNVHRHSHIPES